MLTSLNYSTTNLAKKKNTSHNQLNLNNVSSEGGQSGRFLENRVSSRGTVIPPSSRAKTRYTRRLPFLRASFRSQHVTATLRKQGQGRRNAMVSSCNVRVQKDVLTEPSLFHGFRSEAHSDRDPSVFLLLIHTKSTFVLAVESIQK